jgi:hypothetical protein
MDLSIAKGNSKLGKVYNISLPPEMACGANVPCKKECYARKAWVQYKNVRDAWTKNWDAFQENELEYFETISTLCREKNVAMFRWHVAGDIPQNREDSYVYLLGMFLVAASNPNTHFLAFTKNTIVLDQDIVQCPPNLKIVFSMWPGLLDDATTKTYSEGGAPLPLAWYKPLECDDLAYNRALEEVAVNTTECHGHCDECFKCWTLESSMGVMLEEH